MDRTPLPGRPAAVARVAALLLAAGGGVVWLHGLRDAPWASPPADGVLQWVAAAPVDAVAACVRILALGLCGWVGVTTAAYLVARLVVADDRGGRLRRLTLPAVRDAIDRAVAAGVTGGLLAVPGLPTPGGGPPGPVAPPVAPPPATAPADPAPPRRPATADHAPSGHDLHVVRPGDSLWRIAVTRADGAGPDPVAAHWREIVAAVRGQLRSGDPDLIHPGERLILPPAPDDHS